MVTGKKIQQTSKKGKAQQYDDDSDDDFMPPAPNVLISKKKRKRGDVRPKVTDNVEEKGKKGRKASVGIGVATGSHVFRRAEKHGRDWMSRNATLLARRGYSL